MPKFMSKLRKLKRKKSIPYHFEIHGDEFFVEVVSEQDREKIFGLFKQFLKKKKLDGSKVSVDDVPDFFEADKNQRKQLAKFVLNKGFLEDISKDIRKDVPTFNIVDSWVGKLEFRLIGLGKYEQKLRIKGVCYYEE
jgi:hypothetical protein